MANKLKLKSAHASRGLHTEYIGDPSSPKATAGHFSRNRRVTFFRGRRDGDVAQADYEALRKAGVVK